MFDALKQMAKMSGDEEDKGQLNYHVIIIGLFAVYYIILTSTHTFTNQRTCTISLRRFRK